MYVFLQYGLFLSVRGGRGSGHPGLRVSILGTAGTHQFHPHSSLYFPLYTNPHGSPADAVGVIGDSDPRNRMTEAAPAILFAVRMWFRLGTFALPEALACENRAPSVVMRRRLSRPIVERVEFAEFIAVLPVVPSA